MENSESGPVTCLNCGRTFEGHFCSGCGQKASTRRFTLHHIFHDLFHAWAHFDSGIWRLARDLTVRPAIVVQEYLEGRRKTYFGAMQYLVITMALSTFLTVQFRLMMPSEGVLDAASQGFSEFTTRYFNLIMFLAVPIQALFSKMLFKKAGYFYAEHLVINAFISGHRALFFSLAIGPLIIFLRPLYFVWIGLYTVVWIGFTMWVYVRVFRTGLVWGLTKSFIAIALMYAVHYAIMVGAFILYRQAGH